MKKITPILLAGGVGARLWPFSRESMPKQFIHLIGEYSLFQLTLKRVANEFFEKPIVICSEKYRFIVLSQAADLGVEISEIVLEPEPKNTSPAIMAALCGLRSSGENDESLLILPSDHYIPDCNKFLEMVLKGRDSIKKENILIFGVVASRPETGYGYIEVNDKAKFVTFHEKPNIEKAQAFSTSGRHYWNSGIFFAYRATLEKLYKDLSNEQFEKVKGSLADAKVDGNFLRIDPKQWSDLKSISFDYDVLERSNCIQVHPFVGSWSDLGNWMSVKKACAEVLEKNNVIKGRVFTKNVEDSLIISQDDGPVVGVLGLDNIVAVACKDAVLVAKNTEMESVKSLVESLHQGGIVEATEHRKTHRPWGWFESLLTGDRFQVKVLVVYPGASLSLQSHKYRSEHWVVTNGVATVELGNIIRKLEENHSIYIPQGERHRLANEGQVLLKVIEVQTGSYLGEDDIHRYSDVYDRV